MGKKYRKKESDLQNIRQNQIPFFAHILVLLQELSVVICALITVTAFFFSGKVRTGAAPVTELLFIAGGADAAFTFFPMIRRSTGIRGLFFLIIWITHDRTSFIETL